MPALVVLAAGCFDPMLRPGQPCAPPPQRCPGELVCIDELCVDTAPGTDAAGRADARFDAGPGSDVDGDGVLDTDDNCVDVINPEQWDEDADQLGDRCDVCPHVPDPGQLDADTDGVGDGCDPHPMTGTDVWIAFEGWNGMPAADWTLEAGWTVANGVLRTTDDVAASGRAIYDVDLPRAHVTTHVEIIAVDPGAGATYRSAGVLTAVGMGEYRCLVRDTEITQANAAILRDSTTLVSGDLDEPVLASRTTISLEDRGTTLACDGRSDGGAGWSVAATDATFGSGGVGVRVQHAVAAFAYVAVIQPGP
jgi:hypothetical protein